MKQRHAPPASGCVSARDSRQLGPPRYVCRPHLRCCVPPACLTFAVTMRTSNASVLAASAAVALLALPLDAQRRRSAGRTGDKQLVEKFDTDGNGWLNREERDAARKFLSESQEQGRRRGRRDWAEGLAYLGGGRAEAARQDARRPTRGRRSVDSTVTASTSLSSRSSPPRSARNAVVVGWEGVGLTGCRGGGIACWWGSVGPNRL